MKLQSFLDKCNNDDFILTVDGWCDEMPFYEYDDEKKMDYWKKYKDREIESFAIFMTNDCPELCITLR